MTFFGKFVYMAHHFILLWLNPFGLMVDREEWWFEYSMSQLRVCLSAEGAKNVSWPRLSPLRRWGSLTMTFTGKFIYIHIYIYIYIPLKSLPTKWSPHSSNLFTTAKEFFSIQNKIYT